MGISGDLSSSLKKGVLSVRNDTNEVPLFFLLPYKHAPALFLERNGSFRDPVESLPLLIRSYMEKKFLDKYNILI
jgi:hypothetical protein